jgi:hypothetical protein
MRAKYVVIGVLVGVLLASAAIVLAGSVDPPSGPSDAASQMYTLRQIYRRLEGGMETNKMASFTEPNSGPGVGTMRTLDKIMSIAPKIDDTNGATAEDVVSGKTFWGLTTGGWGPTTGTGAAKPDPPCWNNIHRYVDCGNGTVHDTLTNLIWLKNANCFGQLKYAAANNAAAGLEDGECGLTDGSSPGDWRLPTDHEWWMTIRFAADTMGCTSLGQYDPPSLTNLQGTACFTVLQGSPPQFNNVQVGDYWSSTATADSPYLARYVTLWGGAIGNKNKGLQSSAYVWPVRGGPVPASYP